MRHNNRERNGKHHWMTRTHWDGRPIRAPLLEPTKRSPDKSKEQTGNKHKQRMPQRPPPHDQHHKNCIQGHQFEHHCIQTSDPHVPLRLVPSRVGRIRRQRFCMAVLPPALPPIPCNEQPIGTPRCNHHPLDRYHQGSATAGQLRSLHDRQHHIRRLAPQDKFPRVHWCRLRPGPGIGMHRDGTPASRGIPSGSRVGKTTSPMLSHEIFTFLMTN